MGIYEQLGVRPFINAGGWHYTRYGGSIMPAEVVAAMAEASRQFVNIYELQDQIGKAIAATTNNQAAYVSCGAASGILLAVATCIAGVDAGLADRLPDTQGMRNQIIMRRSERGTVADNGIRAAGGKIVHVGPADSYASADEVLGAINDQTAAIVLVAFETEDIPHIEAIIKGAHQRNIPVLIDGAYAVPPKENLWRYTRDLGVDALITSGGKAIRGPQSTGLVLGSQCIIDGCKFHGSPNLRIGRGMKVGKEEFAGIYAALKLFLAADLEADKSRQKRQINFIADRLRGISGVKIWIHEDRELHLDLDPTRAGPGAQEIAATLLKTDPSILLRGRDGRITVRASLLQEGEEKIVVDRLHEILVGASK